MYVWIKVSKWHIAFKAVTTVHSNLRKTSKLLPTDVVAWFITGGGGGGGIEARLSSSDIVMSEHLNGML